MMPPAQAELSVVQALDLPLPFDWVDPKTGQAHAFSVTPRTLEMEGLLELRLERENIDFVRRHKDNYPLGEYEWALTQVRRDGAAGVFTFGGYELWRWLQSARGWQYNAFLQLSAASPSVNEGQAARIWKDPAARKTLDDLIGRANAIDPNRTAPAAPAPGKTSAANGSSPASAVSPG
jgi:hypothetical protein